MQKLIVIGPESSVSARILLSHRYSFLAEPQGGPTLPLSLCIVCWQCSILEGNVTRTEYEVGNNLLACCNSDVFRFETLSDQSSLL